MFHSRLAPNLDLFLYQSQIRIHFSERLLPRKVVDSLSLEVFKNSRDVALSDGVSGCGGDELTVGLDYLHGLFPDLMILITNVAI